MAISTKQLPILGTIIVMISVDVVNVNLTNVFGYEATANTNVRIGL